MEVIKLVQSVSNPFLDVFVHLITLLGDNNFFIFFFAFIFWCIDKNFGFRLGLVYFSSSTVNSTIKDIFRIERVSAPNIRVLESARGYSFPSGHVQRFVSYIMVFALSIRKTWIYITGILLSILVATSRIYIGVHTPTDVIGGIAIGFIWFLVINWIIEYSNKNNSIKVFGILALVIIIGLLFLKENDYYSNAGIVLSIIGGHLIEKKFINYETKTSRLKQLAKIIIGSSGIILINMFVKPNLSFQPLGIFTRFFLIGIWIIVIAPIIFKLAFTKKIKVEVGI